jgi:hypothetical protein
VRHIKFITKISIYLKFSTLVLEIDGELLSIAKWWAVSFSTLLHSSNIFDQFDLTIWSSSIKVLLLQSVCTIFNASPIGLNNYVPVGLLEHQVSTKMLLRTFQAAIASTTDEYVINDTMVHYAFIFCGLNFKVFGWPFNSTRSPVTWISSTCKADTDTTHCYLIPSFLALFIHLIITIN